MKNIIMLVIDTARAVDTYSGYMPNLNYLARKGTVYENAISPGTWTATSHASFFSGKNVSSLPLASRNFMEKGDIDPWMVKTKFLSESEKTLALKLKAYGYSSIMFSNNPFVNSFTNLGLGFDKTYDIWQESNIKYKKGLASRVSGFLAAPARARMYYASYMVASLIPKALLDKLYLYLRIKLDKQVAEADGTSKLDRGVNDTIAQISHYLQVHAYYEQKPKFMFINLMEAHENYPVSRDIVQDKWLYLSGIMPIEESTFKEFHKGYMKRLSYIDSKLSIMLSTLKKYGMLDDATLIVTSDHGQLFGEHNLLYHSVFPYANEIHVPLVVANYKNGRIISFGDRVRNNISINSLHDAILRLASGKEEYLNGNLRIERYVKSEHTGISEGWDAPLLKLLSKRSSNARAILKAKLECNAKATAIYYGNLKLVHFFGKMKDELYDIEKDPEEENNIISSRRYEAKSLLAKISS
ncbi:MAG: sulfatase-like hydrolase/transferase [Candidatus Micrarchaeia archaeon]